MLMHEVQIKLPSNPKLCKIVRSGVSHLCEIIGFSEDDTNAVVRAVDEALSNIIRHTYAGNTNKSIVVISRVHQDRLEVALRDFGDRIDPNKIKPRDLTDVRPGGLGVHLIRSSMDEVHYNQELDVGNELILSKYLPGKKVTDGS
ncbi:ATP-binding protein [bacterium]|nr:ATP-binding protein [bacterium]